MILALIILAVMSGIGIIQGIFIAIYGFEGSTFINKYLKSVQYTLFICLFIAVWAQILLKPSGEHIQTWQSDGKKMEVYSKKSELGGYELYFYDTPNDFQYELKDTMLVDKETYIKILVDSGKY